MLSFFFTFQISAQDTLMPVIFLDDIVISEENNGFTVEDFIGYVKNDTTFYMGFKHLRYYSHQYNSELNIFNKKGELESEITADRATNFPKRDFMVAKDSVVLKDKEGKMLNTEMLNWDNTTNKIYTNKFVKITTPSEILYGDGLEAEQDFSRYEIKNIKGRIKIDESADSTLQTE